jgi:excisionase family DNA binding protein
VAPFFLGGATHEQTRVKNRTAISSRRAKIGVLREKKSLWHAFRRSQFEAEREEGISLDRIITQKEAAQLLHLSERTLERHRVTGTGPRFVRLGRLVRYRLCDLEQWLENSLRTSTSES